MATKTPIEAGIMARALGGIGARLVGWFGPSEPIAPMVTGDQVDSVRGRQFDFPVAFNRVTAPRSNEAVSFGQLRALADACDVLRLVIETRKDQMAKMRWTVKPVKDGAARDPRCDELEAFFKFPDKENDWDTWLRMMLEEVFVTDAASIYLRKTNGGAMYALEPLDGATIKRVLDEHGRTPMAPDPAYQQVLKGIPAVNYSTDELLYRPRNRRVWKVYGFSPVEQIVLTVNMALRRSVHVLQHYTEGNIPEALIGVPENWNVQQIKEYQTYWDSLMEGDTAQRRHAKFVPGNMKYQPTKDSVLKDEFDDWLARVVCFCFSISPTPFIKETNRATANTTQQAATAEGLEPIMQWVVNLMNFIIQVHFGYKDLCFDWDDKKAQDPLVKAQIDKIYLEASVVDVDEVRGELGRPPLTDEQREKIKASRPAPPDPFGGGGAPGADDDDAPPPPKGGKNLTSEKDDAEPAAKEAIEKAKKRRPGRINPDRATVVKLERKLAKAIHGFFADHVSKAAKAVTKADETDAEAARRAKQAMISVDWDELVPIVRPILERIARTGAVSALDQIGLDDADVEFGPRVTAWAEQRAAEMVGKKWVDGVLVDNPNAEWVITESTRDMIQGLVASATDEGATMDELGALLEDSFAFSEERAMMIARTETRLADSAGQMDAYVESGVVEGTEWSTSQDDQVSELCLANEAAGVVPIGELYPSGDAAPPGHPNCRCCLIASLVPEVDASE
jgi:hypothetical protein